MGIIILLILAGLALWFIWYLFFRSVLWVVEPLIEHMKGREAEKFAVKDIDEDEATDKVEITITSLAEPIHIPKPILQKAQKESQKLPKTNLWVYKDYIFSSRPTKEKKKEMFGE